MPSNEYFCLIVFIITTAHAQNPKSGYENQNVTLICGYQPGITLERYSWTHTFPNTSTEDVIAWEGDQDIIDDRYAERVDVDRGNGEMTLRNLNENDPGTYSCRYKEDGDREQGANVYILTVQLLPYGRVFQHIEADSSVAFKSPSITAEEDCEEYIIDKESMTANVTCGVTMDASGDLTCEMKQNSDKRDTCSSPWNVCSELMYLSAMDEVHCTCDFNDGTQTSSGRHCFSIVQDSTTTPALPQETTPEEDPGGDSGLGGGAIAGIVIAVVIAVCASGCVVYFFVVYKKKRSKGNTQ